MCKRCNRKNCSGYYLLHEKEVGKVPELKETELKKNPNIIFDLKISPSSGESFTKFYELHILETK